MAHPIKRSARQLDRCRPLADHTGDADHVEAFVPEVLGALAPPALLRSVGLEVIEHHGLNRLVQQFFRGQGLLVLLRDLAQELVAIQSGGGSMTDGISSDLPTNNIILALLFPNVILEI